jgi:hypothetical protein
MTTTMTTMMMTRRMRNSRAGPVAKGKPKKLKRSELHQRHLVVAKARPRRRQLQKRRR